MHLLYYKIQEATPEVIAAKSFLGSIAANRRHYQKEESPLIFIGTSTDVQMLKRLFKESENPDDEASLAEDQSYITSLASKTYGIISINPVFAPLNIMADVVLMIFQIVSIFQLDMYETEHQRWTCYKQKRTIYQRFWNNEPRSHLFTPARHFVMFSLCYGLLVAVQYLYTDRNRYHRWFVALGVVVGGTLGLQECKAGHKVAILFFMMGLASVLSMIIHTVLFRIQFHPITSLDDIIQQWAEAAISERPNQDDVQEITLV
jgi:hypothetical protein